MQGRLDNCPVCGNSASLQWFNEECCFVACNNSHCVLCEAEITKWTVFDKKEDAIKHWNDICGEIKEGRRCPVCNHTFLDELEDGVFYCNICKTITVRGTMLTKEKYEEYREKYDLPEPTCLDWCCKKE